jgi:acyl dehydratase
MAETVPGQADTSLLYFEDLQVGEKFLSVGRTVTEADVVNFAGLSGDFHSLHMDETYAAKAYGRRIAHGMLVVSMTSGLVGRLPIMRAIEQTTLGLGSVDCRFLKPTFIGDTIRVQLEVAGKKASSKTDRGWVTMRRAVLNQHGEAVVEGDWKIVVKRRQ